MFQPASMHQSIPAEPRPPPPPPHRIIAGHLTTLSVPGVGHLQILCCLGARPHPGAIPKLDTHAVSYQIIATKRISLGKKADWLICQGQEKIEEGCKGMFLILCMRFFIGYQARITQRNRELLTWINVFWLLNQISVNVFGKHPFIFIKLFITYNFTAPY